jgi:hypothetical protein
VSVIRSRAHRTLIHLTFAVRWMARESAAVLVVLDALMPLMFVIITVMIAIIVAFAVASARLLNDAG